MSGRPSPGVAVLYSALQRSVSRFAFGTIPSFGMAVLRRQCFVRSIGHRFVMEEDSMNRYTARAVPLVLIIMFALSAVSGAETLSTIPSYYSLLDFNLTSPGARATAVGGFANPAVYQMLPGSELDYFWSDEDAQLKSINRWGLFFGTEHLGFSALRSAGPYAPREGLSVVDYRLSLSMGDRTSSLGLAFGWSSGDEEAFGRTRVLQAGTMRRFGRYVSLGLAGTFSLQRDDRIGLADLAVRPLGNDLLTVFGDAEMGKDTRLKDARWSAGAAAEVVPGVCLIGRYFDDESFAFSLGFSFGAAGAAAGLRYDQDGDFSHAVYGVRLGYSERNVFDSYLKKEQRYVAMELKGSMQYRRYRLFDEGPTFYGTIAALEDARHDVRVKGVALNLSGAQIGREKAWEIREKLAELQRDGKHVIVFIDRASMAVYHLASVADRIVMDPDGQIDLPGYLMGRTYMKHLLAKLGLGFDEWRFFTYKSAAEALSRDSMSEPDKEQRFAIIEDAYAEMKKDVSASRGVSGDTFDTWVNDVVVIMPDSAVTMGLVDALGRWEDVKDEIEKLEGTGKGYISPGALARRAFPSTLWGDNPEVAIVYGLGECDMDKGINARQLEKVFNGLRDNRRVKAVVFRVDSPGGDGMASDVVAEALRKCAKKKPVIVTQGEVAGSGGYWISMYGDTILAGPSTITGSIGVIGGWIYDDGIGEKTGLTSDYVKVGDHAELGFGVRLPILGIMIPGRNLTEEEHEKMEHYIKAFYKEFVHKVAEGRHMPADEVAKIAQGRVWSGMDGKANGLIDEIGGLDLAIRIAREAGGIKPGDEIDIVEYPKQPWFKFPMMQLSDLIGVVSPAYTGAESSKSFEGYENYEEMYLKAVVESKGKPLYMVPPEAMLLLQ
jgi:protease-4